jgi:DNA-binding transcriptional regulator YiaG
MEEVTTSTTPIQVLAAEVAASRELPSPAACRALRVSARLSLARVGEAVGVTRQAVWSWEQGTRTPRGEHLRRYLQVLAVLKGSA